MAFFSGSITYKVYIMDIKSQLIIDNINVFKILLVFPCFLLVKMKTIRIINATSRMTADLKRQIVFV